jgi:DNA-binding MarR family transcriptional regulator
VTSPFQDKSGEQSDDERGQLLRLAARRSMVYREVVRHAVQELHRIHAANCPPADETHAALRTSHVAFGESQFRILRCLVEDGSLTVSQLAEACRVSVPAVSRMLNHLEARGWVERRVDATNRRVVHVVATEAGREAEAMMVGRFATALEGVLSPLSTNELEDLITAFGHLERLVSTADAGRCGRARSDQ